MFGSLGFTELLVILVIVLILFGGRKIPALARDIGTGIREFRRSLGDSLQSIRNLPESLEADAKGNHSNADNTLDPNSETKVRNSPPKRRSATRKPANASRKKTASASEAKPSYNRKVPTQDFCRQENERPPPAWWLVHHTSRVETILTVFYF